MAKRVNKVRNLKLREVSLVDDPANPAARVSIAKAAGVGTGTTFADALAGIEELLGSDDVEKDAVSFQQARLASKLNENMWQLHNALMTSVRSIIEDESVEDKAEKIATSVEQYKSALLRELGFAVEKGAGSDAATAGGDAAGGSGQSTGKEDKVSKANESNQNEPAKTGGDIDIAKAVGDAVKGALEPITKSIEDIVKRVGAIEDAQKTAEAVKKAADIAPPGVKPEDLATVLKGLSPENAKVIETALANASAIVKNAAVFGELGASGSQPNAATEDAPIVKAARKRADELEKSARAA